jgi:hypothetical protein
MGLAGTNSLFGVLGAGNSGPGVLITTSELKSSFMGKESFQAGVDPVDAMYVYHNGSDSNYVCFVPKATANRMTGGLPNPNLKCLTLGSGSGAILSDITTGAGGCKSVTDWSVATATTPDSTRANLMCVPEGNVQ